MAIRTAGRCMRSRWRRRRPAGLARRPPAAFTSLGAGAGYSRLRYFNPGRVVVHAVGVADEDVVMFGGR